MRIRTYGVVRCVMQNIRLLDCFFEIELETWRRTRVPAEAQTVAYIVL